MSMPPESREEAIKRLNEQADALRARTETQVSDHGAKAVNYGYRLMGEMIGGLAVGLGLGWGFDLLVGTLPIGIIVGTLTGFGLSVWLAYRSAQRLSAKAAQELGPPRDLPEEPDSER